MNAKRASLLLLRLIAAALLLVVSWVMIQNLNKIGFASLNPFYFGGIGFLLAMSVRLIFGDRLFDFMDKLQ